MSKPARATRTNVLDQRTSSKIRILVTLSEQFTEQERYEEAIKCLEAASSAVDALPVERAKACLNLAILVLEHFDEVEYARTKLLQAVRAARVMMYLLQ